MMLLVTNILRRKIILHFLLHSVHIYEIVHTNNICFNHNFVICVFRQCILDDRHQILYDL